MTHHHLEKLISEQGVLPLFTSAEAQVCREVLHAAYSAGMRVFEFTNRHEQAFAIYRDLLKYCGAELPGMQLGIGTIKTEAEAARFLDAGAPFLISPLIHTGILERCRKQGAFWIPGCATATEIGVAEEAGIGFVKIFPARQLGGPAYLKAMHGPFPGMRFLATGGVETSAADIREWLTGGASAVGIGSGLFPADLLRDGQYAQIERLLAGLLESAREARKRR